MGNALNVFASFDAWLIALTLALAMLVAWGVGLLIGRWRFSGIQPREFQFDDAVLALLSLLLAFTFAMAISKNDQRRTMGVSDANAIGDFYTCAGFVKEPVRTELLCIEKNKYGGLGLRSNAFSITMDPRSISLRITARSFSWNVSDLASGEPRACGGVR